MRPRLPYRLVAAAALLLFFALALDTAGYKAVTTDEPLHLVHSVAMLQTGVMALPEMHVPLTYRLAGGLLRSEGALPDVTLTASWRSANPYEIGREYTWREDLATDRVIWLGRYVAVLMGVLLGALLAGWTWALTGGHQPATVIVLLLYALSPNLLAAAALLTTDMAATLTWFAAVYTWWRYWRRPGWGRWLLAAVALGLALAAKLTGVLLLPVTFVLAYVATWPEGWGGSKARPFAWARPGLVWLSLLPLAGLVLWALYGFDTRAGLPLPAYWEAWRLLLTEVEVSHANFFLGRIAPVGSWLYFPVTLLLKTPLLQLALFLLIPLVLWRSVVSGQRPADGRWRSAAFVALPAVVLLAVAAVSRLNFGYRHALPAIPFLMLLGGLGARWLWELPAARGRVARVALVLAVGWTVVAALRTHPDHLAYFNELARGEGRRYLGDSNLDWGQDLNQLAAYAAEVRAATGRPLLFSYSGIADRAHYGLRGTSLVERFNAGDGFAAANPPAGRYAINASDLQGTGLVLGTLDEIDLFDWFRRRQPLTTLGGSIFVYDVAAAAEGQWIAHCATPGRLLGDPEAERLVGRAGLRHVTFDCQTSWVFPGNAPGWYVLPPGEPWVDAWLGAIRPEVVYRHRANAYGPEYVIVYWAGTECVKPSPEGRTGAGSLGLWERVRERVFAPGQKIPSPAGQASAGSLSLWERVRERVFAPNQKSPSPQPSPEGRGSEKPSPTMRESCFPALRPYSDATSAPAILTAYGARGAEWVTLWEVGEAAAAPLSLQAHLNGPDGTVEVADGLGFTSDQWRPGDWFIQRHLFATPGDTLNTGLYNYATLERVGPTITLTAE